MNRRPAALRSIPTVHPEAATYGMGPISHATPNPKSGIYTLRKL